MNGSFWSTSLRPSAGSRLDEWLGRRAPHPESFVCGVRVTAGCVPGERARWRFRVSAVDRHDSSERIVLRHGPTTLTLRVDRTATPTAGARPTHAMFAAVDVDTGSRVEISAPLGDLVRFGIDL